MTDGPPQGRGTAAPASPELEPAASAERAGFAAVLRYFLRLGTSGFGGPIAVAGYMQRDLVEQRGWIAKQDFLNGSRSAGPCPARWPPRWPCGRDTWWCSHCSTPAHGCGVPAPG